jgi:hypothetical protein
MKVATIIQLIKESHYITMRGDRSRERTAKITKKREDIRKKKTNLKWKVKIVIK